MFVMVNRWSFGVSRTRPNCMWASQAVAPKPRLTRLPLLPLLPLHNCGRFGFKSHHRPRRMDHLARSRCDVHAPAPPNADLCLWPATAGASQGGRAVCVLLAAPSCPLPPHHPSLPTHQPPPGPAKGGRAACSLLAVPPSCPLPTFSLIFFLFPTIHRRLVGQRRGRQGGLHLGLI